MIESWSIENFNCIFEVGLKKHQLKCHKSVLSTVSLVFNDLVIQKEFDNENNHSFIIPIPDVSKDAFVMLCEYAYNGKIKNVEKYRGHTRSNEKSLCYCDPCRKAARNFLGKFHQLCYLIKKYSIIDQFKNYIVDFVENGNVNHIIYRQYYLYYVYDGACRIGAEQLMNLCQEKIQHGYICFITQPIINTLYVDNFVKIIHLLFESLMNSNNKEIFNHHRRVFCYYIFQSLELYAIANNLMEPREGQIVNTKNEEYQQLSNGMEEIQKLFQILIYDERMTPEMFAVGPARSDLLSLEDDLKLSQKFS